MRLFFLFAADPIAEQSEPFLSDEFVNQCQRILKITQDLQSVVSDEHSLRLRVEKMHQCVKAYLACAQDAELQSQQWARIWWEKVGEKDSNLQAQMIHPDEFEMAVVVFKEALKNYLSS